MYMYGYNKNIYNSTRCVASSKRERTELELTETDKYILNINKL